MQRLLLQMIELFIDYFQLILEKLLVPKYLAPIGWVLENLLEVFVSTLHFHQISKVIQILLAVFYFYLQYLQIIAI